MSTTSKKSIFKNRDELLSVSNREIREKVLEVLESAVNAVEPYKSVLDYVSISDDKVSIAGESYDLSKIKRVIVVGGGKGANAMVRAVVDIFGEKAFGIVNALKEEKIGNVICNKASHPLPNASGEKGAREMLKLVEEANEDVLVLCLISGGGSALIPLPEEGITLEDKIEVTKLLLASGADIKEMNTVRKHLSRIKGGKLARAAKGAKVVSLILSDVIGDPTDMIASGPTVPDKTTIGEAISVLNKYQLWEKIPLRVQKLLREGKKETPKPDDTFFRNVRNIIIGNNEKALNGAEKMAKKLGYNTIVYPRILKGEARDAPHKIIFPLLTQLLENKKIKKPAMLIMGGETTVTLRGNGRGGRNQELALSALIGLKQNWTLASMGTDGIDGNSDAAGAIADSDVLSYACKKGLRIMDFLESNNSNEFFAKTNGLLITGPTGTNVADIAILIVE